MPHDTIACADLGETTLGLALDGNVTRAADMLAMLRLLGYSLDAAMLATRDAVYTGLVSHT